jgi:integrase
VQKRAAQLDGRVRVTGNCHILRHTFCSRLAMLGVPAITIKELAGHTSMRTTLRYMHLSPTARSGGIKALNEAIAGGSDLRNAGAPAQQLRPVA